MSVRIRPGYRLLFTGDSVTDCGRGDDPEGLGNGYVRELDVALDSLNAEILNTGINGDRALDLTKRWQQDVIDHNPEVLTVLIGVNDACRPQDPEGPTNTAEFAEDYRYLLQSIPSTVKTVVLIEPFLIPVTPEQLTWRAELAAKQAVVAQLAEEFSAILVPADAELNRLAAVAGAQALAVDGVHPTALGHHKLAQLWTEYVLD